MIRYRWVDKRENLFNLLDIAVETWAILDGMIFAPRCMVWSMSVELKNPHPFYFVYTQHGVVTSVGTKTEGCCIEGVTLLRLVAANAVFAVFIYFPIGSLTRRTRCRRNSLCRIPGDMGTLHSAVAKVLFGMFYINLRRL